MGEKIEFEARMWILHGGASILGGNRLIKVPPGVDVEDKIYRVTLEPVEPELKPTAEEVEHAFDILRALAQR